MTSIAGFDSNMVVQNALQDDPLQRKLQIDALKNNLKNNQNKERKLREACEGFESIFLQKMWEQMRKNVQKEGFLHSKDEEMYQSMFDQELAKKMSSAGGIGLADMLYEQLSSKLGQASQATSPGMLKNGQTIAPLQTEKLGLSLNKQAVVLPGGGPLLIDNQGEQNNNQASNNIASANAALDINAQNNNFNIYSPVSNELDYLADFVGSNQKRSEDTVLGANLNQNIQSNQVNLVNQVNQNNQVGINAMLVAQGNSNQKKETVNVTDPKVEAQVAELERSILNANMSNGQALVNIYNQQVSGQNVQQNTKMQQAQNAYIQTQTQTQANLVNQAQQFDTVNITGQANQVSVQAEQGQEFQVVSPGGKDLSPVNTNKVIRTHNANNLAQSGGLGIFNNKSTLATTTQNNTNSNMQAMLNDVGFVNNSVNLENSPPVSNIPGFTGMKSPFAGSSIANINKVDDMSSMHNKYQPLTRLSPNSSETILAPPSNTQVGNVATAIEHDLSANPDGSETPKIPTGMFPTFNQQVNFGEKQQTAEPTNVQISDSPNRVTIPERSTISNSIRPSMVESNISTNLAINTGSPKFGKAKSKSTGPEYDPIFPERKDKR